MGDAGNGPGILDEHEARDDRSMVSVAPQPSLQLLSAFVPANEGAIQTGPPEDESDNESNTVTASGDGGESDSEGAGNVQDVKKHKIWVPPSLETANAAHRQLDAILNPRRNSGNGHKDLNLDLLL